MAGQWEAREKKWSDGGKFVLSIHVPLFLSSFSHILVFFPFLSFSFLLSSSLSVSVLLRVFESARMSSSYDVIVVGAGIAGSTLAATLGKQGRKVLIIERDIAPPDTFRGELLQPGGVKKIQELGLGSTFLFSFSFLSFFHSFFFSLGCSLVSVLCLPKAAWKGLTGICATAT